MPRNFMHECTLCGYVIPFEPFFEIETIQSGAYPVLTADNQVVNSSAVAYELAEHLLSHEEIWDGDFDPDGDPNGPARWKVRCGQPAAGEVMGRPFCQRHLALRPAGNR